MLRIRVKIVRPSVQPDAGAAARPAAEQSDPGDQPYLRLIRPVWCALASGVSTSAKPGAGAPSGVPRQSQGPTVTRPLLRIRFTLPASAVLHTAGARPSSMTRTGVGTAVPFRRKVVRSRYLPAANSAGPASM